MFLTCTHWSYKVHTSDAWSCGLKSHIWSVRSARGVFDSLFSSAREMFSMQHRSFMNHAVWDVSSVWAVYVACFRTTKFDNFWAILFILVRPSCINVIFHTKFVNYCDVLKPY